jgi:hypothetical protein
MAQFFLRAVNDKTGHLPPEYGNSQVRVVGGLVLGCFNFPIFVSLSQAINILNIKVKNIHIKKNPQQEHLRKRSSI